MQQHSDDKHSANFGSNPKVATNFDTACIQQALDEFKERFHLAGITFDRLPANAQSFILQRAQEIKTSKTESAEMRWLNEPIAPGSPVRNIDYEEWMSGQL